MLGLGLQVYLKYYDFNVVLLIVVKNYLLDGVGFGLYFDEINLDIYSDGVIVFENYIVKNVKFLFLYVGGDVNMDVMVYMLGCYFDIKDNSNLYLIV